MPAISREASGIGKPPVEVKSWYDCIDTGHQLTDKMVVVLM